MKRNLIIGLTTCFTLIIAAITAGCIWLQSDTILDDYQNSALADPGDQPPYNFDYSWVDKYPYIAHAMGGILGDVYTNSYEAFLLNYQLGQRVFEVDFVLTEDDETVAQHYSQNWLESTSAPANTPFTYDNVKSYLIQDKYHALDYRQVIDIMAQYPDIYIVTDTKYVEQDKVDREFRQLIEYAQSAHPETLDRFIIQIYRPEMLNWLMDYYPWKSMIYTLYNDPNWTPENVIEFAAASGIRFITIWEGLATPELLSLWKSHDLLIGVHTLNDLAVAERFRSLGTDSIYTDFLIP